MQPKRILLFSAASPLWQIVRPAPPERSSISPEAGLRQAFGRSVLRVRIDRFPAQDGEQSVDIVNVVFRDGHVIPIQHGQVGVFADFNRAYFLELLSVLGRPAGGGVQSFLAIDALR